MKGVDPLVFQIGAIVASVLIGALVIVDDRIVHFVCKREGRRYIPLLTASSFYWQWRIFKFSWFAEAKAAGFLALRVTLCGLWIVFFVISVTYLEYHRP